jgi:hypothetical protein
VFFAILYWGLAKTDLPNPTPESEESQLDKYLNNMRGVLYRFTLIFFFQAIGPVSSMCMINEDY